MQTLLSQCDLHVAYYISRSFVAIVNRENTSDSSGMTKIKNHLLGQYGTYGS